MPRVTPKKDPNRPPLWATTIPAEAQDQRASNITQPDDYYLIEPARTEGGKDASYPRISLMPFREPPTSPFDKEPPGGRNGHAMHQQQQLPLAGVTSDIRRRQMLVDGHFMAGREAIRKMRWDEVEAPYRRIIDLLEERADPAVYGKRPLYDVLPNGNELYRRAMFRVAAYTDPKNAPAVLTRLHQIEWDLKREPDTEARKVDCGKVKMLRAFTLMQYTAATNIQRVGRFREAEKIINAILEGEVFKNEPDVLFAAEALRIELIARHVERAHHRGDRKARRLHLERLEREMDRLFGENSDSKRLDRRNVVALYEADVATMLGRMGLWGVALRRARNLTQHKAYRKTLAAQRILEEPIFEPFVEDGRFLTPKEIKAKTPRFKAIRSRIRAALANAHSESILQSLASGAVTAGLFGIAYFAITGEPPPVIESSMAAGVGSVVNKFWNGYISQEAREVGEVGVFPGTAWNTVGDVTKLLGRGALSACLYSAPIKFISVLPQAMDVAGATFANAADLYGRFGVWLAEGATSLFFPQTYAHWYDSLSTYLSDQHPLLIARDVAYLTYLGLAAKHYLSYMIYPSRRDELRKKALWYVPGAVFLGSELGQMIVGQDDLFDRLGRSSIALIEGTAMLFTAGVIALAKNRSLLEATKSMWSGFTKTDHNALVAIALTVGISSALGGQMQKGPELNDIGLIATRGVATTVGLLPIVVLSGIMKGTITLPEGVREGWQDSKDSPMWWRGPHAVAGGLSAFRTPYVLNRLWRAVLLDIPAAIARTFLGWDTNVGQAAFSGINILMTNPTATMTFPETGRTDWERKAIMDMLRNRESGPLRDHWRKAALRMPLDHVLQPHRLWDALFPLTAIRRAVKPPVFPLKPQTYYFANLYQLITNGYYQDFDEEVMEILLEEVASYVIDGATTNGEGDSLYAQAEKLIQLDIGRGLVRTLILAANSDDRHGPRIKRFLAEHRWIYDITSIDPDEMPAIKGGTRRRQRRKVREALEKSREFYAEEIKEHARSKEPGLVDDLFKVRSESKDEASGPGGPASRVKKNSKQGSVDFDPEGGTAPLTPAPVGSTPSPAPAAAMSADSIPSIIEGVHILTAGESGKDDSLHLGSFWEEEEPQKQEVIIKPISARELRRRRTRSREKTGQSIILPGARPLPPASANVPQIILATEAAAKPFLP